MDTPVVNSHNEWDPLEEVIVGILDGAADLTWEIGPQALVAYSDSESVFVQRMARPRVKLRV